MKTDRKLYEAISKRNREKTKSFAFRFNIDTQKDIIDFLESKPNKAGYIASLIKNDMLNGGTIDVEKPLLLCDLAKEDISDNDEVVLHFPDLSTLHTTREKVLDYKKTVIKYDIYENIDHKTFHIYVRY